MLTGAHVNTLSLLHVAILILYILGLDCVKPVISRCCRSMHANVRNIDDVVAFFKAGNPRPVRAEGTRWG